MHIELARGSREHLRPLFELAEDSPALLDAALGAGEVLVARDGEQVIGHLQLVPTDAPGAREIKNMAVVPERQGTGVGRALVERAVATARDEGAERILVATAASDVGNLRFYQRLGFRMLTIEREAFTPDVGYPPGLEADGIPVLDRVWFDRHVHGGAVVPAADVGSDRELVESAACRLSVPRDDVPPNRISFVLHAPLELLARAALLPAVDPLDRPRARARITTLLDGFEAAAPAWTGPALDATSRSAGSRRSWNLLAHALDERDAGAADVAARSLDDSVAADALVQGLAPRVLPALAAAGHGNIYLSLLARETLARPTATMLPSLVHSLVTDPAPPVPVPPSVTTHDPQAHERLVAVLHTAEEFAEAPPSTFIAPLVQHALAQGIGEWLATGERFVAPARPPVELLRFAALAMLQGDPEQAPYGWTHCLTLAQGALRVGELTGSVAIATYVATTYLLAHWGAYGSGTLDWSFVPEIGDLSLADALVASPAQAAAAAWHTPDRAQAVRVLASAASVNHDAHRVKYTLACIDAAMADRDAAALHLAAAAHLNAWWEQRGDPDDPWR